MSKTRDIPCEDTRLSVSVVSCCGGEREAKREAKVAVRAMIIDISYDTVETDRTVAGGWVGVEGGGGSTRPRRIDEEKLGRTLYTRSE